MTQRINLINCVINEVILQITSSSYEKFIEIPIKKEDFRDGNLKKDSYLRIDKIASIDKSLIKYKVGFLKQNKIEEIINKVTNYLKSD